jgi:hypothetical protein
MSRLTPEQSDALLAALPVLELLLTEPEPEPVSEPLPEPILHPEAEPDVEAPSATEQESRPRA